MSQELLAFLEGMDSSFTSGLAATLTGISLTAAALLANLVKSQSDKLKELYGKMTTRELDARQEVDPANRVILIHAATLAKRQYEEAFVCSIWRHRGISCTACRVCCIRDQSC